MPWSVQIRSRPEDFQVEEIPAYIPSGDGPHLYLWVEKRDLKHGEMLRLISRFCGVRMRDIGTAGRKDDAAVTRQFVSIPLQDGVEPGPVSDQLNVLEISRHSNRLKTGHLRGNRFRITARGEEPFGPQAVEAIAERLSLLEVTGFPNYFGPQRFGGTGEGVARAVANLTSGRQRKSHSARFEMSVVQSAVFNLVLRERVIGQRLTPEQGDVVIRKGGLRPFAFDDRGDTPAEALVPAGPMPGRRMAVASGEPKATELRAIEQCGVSDELFESHRKLAPGTRRPLVQFFGSPTVELDSTANLVLEFDLPPGTYATAGLRELFAD